MDRVYFNELAKYKISNWTIWLFYVPEIFPINLFTVPLIQAVIIIRQYISVSKAKPKTFVCFLFSHKADVGYIKHNRAFCCYSLKNFSICQSQKNTNLPELVK